MNLRLNVDTRRLKSFWKLERLMASVTADSLFAEGALRYLNETYSNAKYHF